MKILNLAFVLLVFFATIIPAYSSGVLCNSNKTVCTVGKYTLRGPNLYVEDGIMCTSNRNICTNGETVLRTGGVIKKHKKKENVNRDTNNNTNNVSTEIIQISETEELAILADLYKKGYVTQLEFNRLKTNIQVIEINELEELKKMADLYESGFITQFEFNRYKSNILNP